MVNTELRRELGLREAVALGIGGTVGGGIFVLVGVAGGLAGPAALLAFGLAFAVAALIALPYAELACRLPLAGGGYAFARQVLGEHWGFLMGWIYWGGYVFVSGYVTLGFGGYLRAATGLPTAAGAVALVTACTAVNLVGVKVSGRVQSIVLGAAIAGLLGFALWGLPHVDVGRLTPFAPHGAGGILVAALVAFLSFGGFDMVAAAGEEVRRPERTLPRAILLTLAVVLGLYLLVAFVALGTVPAGLLGSSPAPLADAATTFGGAAARRLVVGIALLTTAATANAVLVVTSRTLFAMGRDRLLPARLRAVRAGTPWVAVLVNGVLLAVIALTAGVAVVSSIGGFLYVLHFLPPLVALVRLRRDPAAPQPAFRTPAFRLVVPLAFACATGLLVAGGVIGATVGTGWVLLGTAGYAVRRWIRR